MTLPYPLNQTNSFLGVQFVEQLDCLLCLVPKRLRNVIQGKYDIYPALLVVPPVLHGQAHAVKQDAVEQLGICRYASKPAVCKEQLGDTVK